MLVKLSWNILWIMCLAFVTLRFFSDVEFKAAYRNSAKPKLFDIRGTTVYKCFTFTPFYNVITQGNRVKIFPLVHN